MFDAIKIISERSCDHATSGQCTLETVTNIVTAYTKIDEVRFVCYPASPSNPIWGEFLRWQQFKPYEGEKSIVEVRYASHLDEAWKRFVVCKEMAHALDGRKGSHTVSDDDVKLLITELALASAIINGKDQSNDFKFSTMGISAEKIAESGALEMLLPLKLRRELLRDNADIDELTLKTAQQHELPLRYVRLGFMPEYNDLIEQIL